MTLILTVANSSGAYQSSDYQLTDPTTGAMVSDLAGSKQLVSVFEKLHLVLAFTGVASVGAGSTTQRTIDCLSAVLKALPVESSLQAISQALAKKIEEFVQPCGSRGLLTLVLSVASLGKPFQVVVISNADWERKPPSAKNHFDIRVRRVQKPFYLISGFRDCVSDRERALLKAVARKISTPQAVVMTALTEINSIAARNSGGWVSEGCWVTAQVADGKDLRSTTRNVGAAGGSIPHLVRGMDFTDVVKNFRAAPGKEIRLVRSGLSSGPGTPGPGPEGEPKSFLISGSPIKGLLRSPSGQHCASIEIILLSSTITAKRNESVTVPFAEIRLTGIRPISEDFAKPLLPWATLWSPFSVDGVAVPLGWQYTVGYWIENGAHHVEIPLCSRGVWKIAFLGDDDELVVAAPVQSRVFSWESIEDGPSAVLEATVRWHVRDGTHG